MVCFLILVLMVKSNSFHESLFVLVQAEKDAKRKARAKELKKLRKAKQKKAQVYLNWFQSHYLMPSNQLYRACF